MNYHMKNGRIDNKYNNDQDTSINDNNQSKYSNLLDNSFIRVNSKIDEFKNSIREKIRVMKNNNLIYSNNSNNNNRILESCSKNEYSNNISIVILNKDLLLPQFLKVKEHILTIIVMMSLLIHKLSHRMILSFSIVSEGGSKRKEIFPRI
jgi:hypothetical protein